MKKSILLFFSISLSVLCWAQSISTSEMGENSKKDNRNDTLLCPFKFISKSDAEKIFGQPAFLKDSLLKYYQGYLRARLQFNYKSNFKDSVTGQISTLFFGLEQYDQLDGAKRSYNHMRVENEKLSKVSALNEIGEESFMVIDQLDNPLIVFRKDKKIFKLNLFHRNDNASLEELQKLARRIGTHH